MMRNVGPVSLVALACCADPVVQVSITAPADLSGVATLITLQVLAPTSAADFSCDDLAFGLVADTTLAATRVEYTSMHAGESTPLDGLPRTGHKLFLAEAFDDGGELVAAICDEARTIDRDLTLDLTLEPATTLIATWGSGLNLSLGSEPIVIVVRVADHLANLLVGASVRWRLLSPAGEVREGEVTTGAATEAFGEAELEVPVPSLRGPARLEMRSRWQRGQPVTVDAMLPPESIAYGQVDGAISEVNLARAGPDGRPALVGVRGNELDLLYLDTSTPTPVMVRSTQILPESIAAMGVARLATHDEVVAVTLSGWYRVRWDGWTQAPLAGLHPFLLTGDLPPSPALRPVAQVRWLSSCSNDRSDGALCVIPRRAPADESLRPCTLVDVSGAPVAVSAAPFASAQFSSTNLIADASCLPDPDGVSRPAMLINTSAGATISAEVPLLVESSPGVLHSSNLHALPFIAGFTPALALERSYLVSTDHQPERVELTLARIVGLVPGLAEPVGHVTLEFEVGGSLPGDPGALATGDLDGDGRLDAATLNLLGGPNLSKRPMAVLLSLGLLTGELALANHVLVSPAADDPYWNDGRIWIEDFDGDGFADVGLWIWSLAPGVLPEESSVRILRMGPFAP
jgi:hypothetical protein